MTQMNKMRTTLKLFPALIGFVGLAVGWVLSIVFLWPLLSLVQLIRKPKHPEEPTIPPKTDHDLETAQFRVAVIGAGWTGLCAAQALRQRGVHVEIFEMLDDLGGTWHPSANYEGLLIHGPLLGVELNGFPHPDMASRRFERLSSGDFFKYLSAYADYYGLRRHIRFGTKVLGVDHSTTTRLASVRIADVETGNETEIGGFNAVIHASLTQRPVVPNFPGREEFTGEIVHSSAMNADKVREVMEGDKRVVVLGGSKSAVDMLCLFVQKGYRNVKWLYRKSYLFVHYDAFAHQHAHSVFGRLRGFFTLQCLTLSTLSTTLACAGLRALGVIESVFDKHFDLTRCHFGVLKQSQFYTLRENFKDRVKAPLTSLKGKGLYLDGGARKMNCDVLLCCTGYTTGFADIALSIDGERFLFPEGHVRLFEHLVLPDFPSLILTSGFYQLGPRRGTSIGEHVLRYLCRQPSQARMRRSARWNLLAVSPRKNALFSSERPVSTSAVLWMIDVFRAGVFSLPTLFSAAYGVWVTNERKTLHVKNLDRDLARLTVSEGAVPALAVQNTTAESPFKHDHEMQRLPSSSARGSGAHSPMALPMSVGWSTPGRKVSGESEVAMKNIREDVHIS